MIQEIDAKFHVQAAALCAQLQRRDCGRIIQINMCIGKNFNGMSKKRPFIFL